MTLDEIKERIEKNIEGAEAMVMDQGGGDHIHAIVISPLFRDKSLIDQHRMVLTLFRDEIESNEVHALQVKTFSPEKAEAEGITK